MEVITSLSNKWIKIVSQLRIKKYRDKNSSFIMEGIRLVEELIKLKKTDVICFVLDKNINKERIENIIKSGEVLNWEILFVNEKVMNKLSGTEHTQGILAIVKKPYFRLNELCGENIGKYVFLDEVQDPGNIGTIIRTAAGAGMDAVILSKGCADPYSEKVIRSSMGSILRIPIITNVSIDELIEWKINKKIYFVGTSLQNAEPYTDVLLKDGCLFMFGNEGNGISKELLDISDKRIFIPLKSNVESLNVSIAAAVILFYYAKIL